MPGINELFNQFPDYDVFTDKTIPSNNPPARRRPPQAPPRHNPQPVKNTDYRDGYGLYREHKTAKNNYMTVFFFPLSILWMEIFLKIGVGAGFDFMSAVYTVLFSAAISCVITFFCSFGKAKVNRRIANIILLLLTAVYMIQLAYFGKYSAFFTFSGAKNGAFGLSDFAKAFGDKPLLFIALMLPLLFGVTIGRFFFAFRKVKPAAKISLILVSALLITLAFSAVNFTKGTKNSPYSLFNESFNATASHSQFGLLTTEYLDIKNLFS
jgi:hypothetical protein